MRLNESINRWVRDKEYERTLRQTQGLPETAPGGLSLQDDKAMLFLSSNTVYGINYSKALERFGDATTYLDSLQSFAKHTPDLLEELKQEDAITQYAITVHGIKGSCFGVGAESLGEKAAELEKQAKAGNKAYIVAHSDEFIDSGKRLIENLQAVLKKFEAIQNKPIKSAPDPQLLLQIKEAAVAYNMGTLDSIMTELEKFNYETQSDLVVRLREYIDCSDLEAVEKQLNSIV
jgi:HPt (histidine-containing phosphotransfer) domain-containing protein